MGDLKYGEFEFPSDRGFTGSAGKTAVSGYMRGGKVKATHEKKAAAKKRPVIPAAGGGHMKHGKHVGGPDPAAEYPKSQARQTMPKNVKARGGKMKKARGGTVGVVTEPGPKQAKHKSTFTAAARGGSTHDKLMKHGKRMGYAQGGYATAKDTSSEFDMKSKKQDTMDHGTYAKGAYANEAEKEAGGRKKVRPKFAEGGGVKTGGRQAAEARRKVYKGKRNVDHTKGKGKSKKGMPKNVKARGGLAQYAEGGNVSVEDVPGTGGARRAAEKIKERERRTRRVADEAKKYARQTSPSTKPRTHDRPPAKKQAPRRIYREDEGGVPTFTDVPKTGTPYKRR